MLEIFLSFILAVVAGILAGMVPGISTFVVLVTLYPLLLILDPVNVIMVYVIIVSISQYFSSVAATFFCIPGSTTAMLYMHEAHTLFKKGEGASAIMFTACGSFIGSIASLLLSFLLISTFFIFYGFFSTYVKAVLLLLSVVLFIFVGRNSKLINLVMILIGYALAEIGYNSWTDTSFMTFGIIELYSGLPTISVLLGLYIIPIIISNIKKEPNIIRFTKLSFSSYTTTFKELINYKETIIRGSIIGYFSGFIPGLTYYLGTAFSYYLEKYIRQKNNSYTTGDINCLLAAETANNSGIFSQLIPLLLIGIPITASQAFIYDIFIGSGILLTSSFFYSMLTQLSIAYILSSVIGLLIAGKYVNWLSSLANVNYNYIYYLVIIILSIVTFYIGSLFYSQWFYIICLILLIPFGLLLTKYDVLPLVFTFLLHDEIYANFLTLIYLL